MRENEHDAEMVAIGVSMRAVLHEMTARRGELDDWYACYREALLACEVYGVAAEFIEGVSRRVANIVMGDGGKGDGEGTGEAAVSL